MKQICKQIIIYEELIWNYLTDVFYFGLKASELGITNDLIYRIVSFYIKSASKIEVYAAHSKKEYIKGSDIDLFIKKNRNYYQYYKLQAKMMDFKGQYYDIAKWSNNAQYNKIIKSSKKESAFPLYLLYNGLTAQSATGVSNKWGLSLVEAVKIRDYRRAQKMYNKNPLVHNLTFDILHAMSMKPFHNLFCSKRIEYELPEPVGYDNIYKGPPYDRIILENQLDNVNRRTDETASRNLLIMKERNLSPLRLIVDSE